MSLTDDQYRKGMRQLAAAVSVITAEHDGMRNGLTATAVMSVCADPPRLAAAVNRTASALPTLLAADAFSVNVLRYDQASVAARFANSEVRGEARFDGEEWSRLSTGAPVLAGAAAAFDCRICTITPVGTHLLIVADVEALQVNPTERPLLYLDGGWACLIRPNGAEVAQYDATVARCIETVDRASGHRGTAAEKLGAFVRAFTAINISHTGITRGFLNKEPYLSAEKLAHINAAKDQFDRKLRQLIAQGMKSGEFDLDEPALAALAITGMVSWMHRWYSQEGRYTPEEIAEKLTRMALNMVRATDARASATPQH